MFTADTAQIKTGAKNGASIQNPFEVYKAVPGAVVQFCPSSAYVFNKKYSKQQKNYEAINAVLKLVGTELGDISAAEYDAAGDYITRKPCRLTTFVVQSKDGSLLWQKYEGSTKGGGHNWIYLRNGKKIHTTTFVSTLPAVAAEWVENPNLVRCVSLQL